ncbi:hypothetical protein J437_LFUL010072, partial [Ladona fulva]
MMGASGAGKSTLMNALAHRSPVSEEKLQNCVTEWGDERTRKEMEINVKKRKVISIAKKGNQNTTIKYKNEELEQVDGYEYLVTIVTSDGRYDEEILNRKRRAYAMYNHCNETILGKKE